jgi:hypothetical protein
VLRRYGASRRLLASRPAPGPFARSPGRFVRSWLPPRDVSPSVRRQLRRSALRSGKAQTSASRGLT